MQKNRTKQNKTKKLNRYNDMSAITVSEHGQSC